jgi:hypothetical protein
VSCKTINSTNIACNDSIDIFFNDCSNFSSDNILFNSNVDNVTDNVTNFRADNVDNVRVPVITHNVTHGSILHGKLAVGNQGNVSPDCLCEYYDTACTSCNFVFDNSGNTSGFKPIYNVRGFSYCDYVNTVCYCYRFVQGGNSPLVQDSSTHILVYGDIVDKAYIAHPHYARFFKYNYWFDSFDSKFWVCIYKFPIAIFNASNICVISYIVSSLSVFNARYLCMLHHDKLRDFMFKGKQYSSFQQLSCSTCCNMSVNCECYDLIGLATDSKLFLAGNYCRSFQCGVNTVFGACSCLAQPGCFLELLFL